MNNDKKSNIFKLIALNYRKYQLVLDSELKKINVTRGEYPFLACLYNNRATVLNQNQISKILGVDRAHTNRYLKKLESSNLITREASSNNNRIFDIYLTESGKKKAKEILSLLKDFSKELLIDFDTNQIDALYSGLSNIGDLLDQKILIQND